MRVVVDENIPGQTIAWFLGGGHAVIEARKPPLRASDDDAVWIAAQREQALLVTTDKGFADRWIEPHFGILIVRLRQPNRQKIHDRVVLAMNNKTERDWENLLVVMRDQTQTTRRTPDRS